MIRIEVDSATLGRTRIAVSPLWEAIGSAWLLARGGNAVGWPYGPWARAAVRAASYGPAVRLPEWYAEFGADLPGFLLPIPTGSHATIADELAQLRATNAASIGDELAWRYPDGVPAALDRFTRDPAGSMAWYADALEAHWHAAVAPYWAPMCSALDEEVLLRARILATEGSAALLSGLSGRVRWERPWISLAGAGTQDPVRCVAELVVVPMLFARGAALCSTGQDGSAAVSYQARGAAVLGDRPPAAAERCDLVPARGDRLAILLGRRRAAVVRALVKPTTTSTLAASLGLAASTVSEHLTALVVGGLVKRRRAGVRVIYELDRSGLALLGYLDSDAGRSIA